MKRLSDARRVLTCRAGGGQAALHSVEGGTVVWDADEIVWVGPEKKLPDRFASAETLDAGGALVLPGLVDAHTHLAFGGWRADEFVRRVRGVSYAEIAAEGGGILSTVRATREASTESLRRKSDGLLRQMLALGVTTVEAKSGYGLSTEEEHRVLRLYRDLDDAAPQTIVPTFLGAHTVPPEYAKRRAAYVDLVVDEMIPRVAGEGLARFCDVFLEEGAFGRDEARRILEAGAAAGLRPKLHADQLSDGGGAALGAELGAASVDHLEEISEDGVAALAASDTVAVLLPLATLYLGQRPPPARRLVDAGVPVSVATDFNPGSAPSHHLPLALTLACTLLGLTPAEAVKGATLQAARALELEETVGSLEPGKRADLVLLDAPDEDHWLYHFRANACRCVVAGGEVAWTSS